MAAPDWSKSPAVESVPDRVGGAWVFKGTRLPVVTVIENLEDLSVDEVIEQFEMASKPRMFTNMRVFGVSSTLAGAFLMRVVRGVRRRGEAAKLVRERGGKSSEAVSPLAGWNGALRMLSPALAFEGAARLLQEA
jgi:uncharacterized protein (DUF433 family)